MSDGVSFVVPVYNKAPWLAGVLDRIAAQRGAFAREFVFVDDGSTDDSLAILKAWTAGWPGARIVEQANRGVAHATNRGLAAARMPLVKLCDADDLLADGATEALRAALLKCPDAVLAFGGLVKYDDSAGLEFGADLSGAEVEVVADPLRMTIRNCPFIPAQCLMRAAVAREVGGCDERLRTCQDYSLWLRMAWRGPFLRIEAPVAFWPREAPGRLSDLHATVARDTVAALRDGLRGGGGGGE